MTHSERCSETTPEHSATSPSPALVLGFLSGLGGKAVRFFHFVFFVSGSVSLVVFGRSSLLRVAVWKNFRERTFVFECRGWSCVFR